ncbi:translation elongation factor EF1B gamma [Tulasnella sp. 418]|nr:translation elongation factor EF1B gamma [Tulasnella sp. 418]
MRALGENITDEESQDIVNEMGTNGTIDFAQFLTLMARKMSQGGSQTEIREAFRALDREKTGYISTADLKTVMLNIGETLTEAEADEMLREADPDGTGWIDYEGMTES